MTSVITKAKQAAFKKYISHLRAQSKRLLHFRVGLLVNRGIKFDQVLNTNKELVEMIVKSLGDFAKDPKLNTATRKDVLNFYFHIINEAVNQLAAIDMSSLAIQPEHREKMLKSYLEVERSLFDIVLDFQNTGDTTHASTIEQELSRKVDSFKRTIDTLFSTPQAEPDNQLSTENKFVVRLGSGFEDVLAYTDKQFVQNYRNQQKVVTVIYPIRDRDVSRLIPSVKSLAMHSSVGFEIVVVDYGSKVDNSKRLADICWEYGWKFVRSETEGWPWSRSRALNVGVMSAETNLVATTDIDMVFMSDVLGEATKLHKDKTVVHCRPWWLRENGHAANAWLGDFNQIGGFQLISKNDFMQVGGFNENILFWGLEDLELDKRLKAAQYEVKWLDENNKMYHMWHPTDYGYFDKRPLSSWMDSSEQLMAAGLVSFEQRNFGKAIDISARPILKKLQDRVVTYKLKVGEYPVEFDSLLAKAKEHELVYLELGARMNPDVSKYISILPKIDEYLQLYGLELKVRKNQAFDYFYLSLDLLWKAGMIDYYINDDFSGVYLIVKSQK